MLFMLLIYTHYSAIPYYMHGEPQAFSRWGKRSKMCILGQEKKDRKGKEMKGKEKEYTKRLQCG